MPRIEAALVHHVATRMGLDAPASARPAHAEPASPPLTTRAPRGPPRAPAAHRPDMLWPSTVRQGRGKTARRSPARVTRMLLPLGVMLLMAGSALRPGEGLQEHDVDAQGASCYRASAASDLRASLTRGPCARSSGDRCGCRTTSLRAPGGREAREGGEPRPLRSGRRQRSPRMQCPAPPPAPRPEDDQRASPSARAQNGVCAVPCGAPASAPVCRRTAPANAAGAAPRPSQPLAQRGLATSPHIPTRTSRSARHVRRSGVSDSAEASTALPGPPASRRSPEPTGGHTDSQQWASLGAPATTPPRLPLRLPWRCQSNLAAFPQSPEPPPSGDASRTTRPDHGRGDGTAGAHPISPGAYGRDTHGTGPDVRLDQWRIPRPHARGYPPAAGVYGYGHRSSRVSPNAVENAGGPHWGRPLMTKSGGGSWPPAYTPRASPITASHMTATPEEALFPEAEMVMTYSPHCTGNGMPLRGHLHGHPMRSAPGAQASVLYLRETTPLAGTGRGEGLRNASG